MDFLNFDNDNSLTGFRLKTFELLNWGTFNTITKIEPDSANSLLTGNVGSGKSTVVDAITTLLVPHNKIIYNRAAGAEWKERTIYSYVRGEYRTEKTGREQSAKPVYLRDDTHYTVILGHFYNSGYLETVTLAQVFYIRGGSIEKFFVVSRNKLTIKEHFTGFGTDIKDLKKKLKNIE
ncbi:MAG TPA: ATP-dependent exonuclease SbcCD, C subunit-like protein, partial [Spirochaetia bacterium]|nr:ATP-dependent exonuclease SbcCD, C subunit-like protein [Spirochaetia bacterium]